MHPCQPNAARTTIETAEEIVLKTVRDNRQLMPAHPKQDLRQRG